jgi:uncharacterized protein
MNDKSTVQFYNPWWINGKIPPELLKRYKNKHIVEAFDSIKIEQTIILSGLRGVGKSSMIFHLIDMLLKVKVKPENILFFNLLYGNCNILEIIKEYSLERLKVEIQNINQSVYIFIGNAQYKKGILDDISEILLNNKYVHIILSFSGSIELFAKYTGISRNQAGLFHIFPLSLNEYLEQNKTNAKALQFQLNDILDFEIFRNRKKDLLRNENKIMPIYDKYTNTSSLSDFSNIENAFIRTSELKTKVLNNIIYKDMNILYDVKFPQQMDILFSYLCRTSSKVSNQLDMSKRFGISYPSLLNYLKYFKNSLLISDSRNYYMGSRNEKRTNRKFFIADIGFMDFNEENLPERIKTLIFNHCNQIAEKRGWEVFYWQHDRVSIDIMLDIKQMIIPIDIKIQDERVGQKDLKAVTKFLEKYRYERGVIITKNEFDIQRFEKCEVMLLPVWMLLLSF